MQTPFHRLRPARALSITLAVTAAVVSMSCDKDPRETSKFPRADQNLSEDRRITPLERISLSNGVTVYFQGEHTDEMVAVEVFYRGGLFEDPAGKPQLAHLTEHAVVHAACGEYGEGESVSRVRKTGMLAAEAIGDYVHYDYFVPYEKLDETLAIEAARLTSCTFTPDLLESSAKSATRELSVGALGQPSAIQKPALIALRQVLGSRARHVPVKKGLFDRTPEEVRDFQNTYYRPDDMVIVIIGGFDRDAAEQMVRAHFEGIDGRPAAPAPSSVGRGDVSATWDIDASIVFYVYDGPYESLAERLALTMFGSFLRRQLSDDQAMRSLALSMYSSNPVYPTGRIPFFVWGQPADGKSLPAIRSELDRVIANTIDAIDPRTFDAICQGAKRFVSSSMIKQANPYVPRQQFLGQEALNTGLKHYYMEGMSREDFDAMVDAMTFEGFRETIARRITESNRRVVEIRPK